MLCGRASDAVQLMEASIREQESLGQQNTLAFWMTWLAEAYLAICQHDDARQIVGRAFALARERHQRGVQAICRRLEAEVTIRIEPVEPGAAERDYGKALALGTELGMRPLLAHCHLGLGKLYRRIGTRESAREHLTTATSMYREMGMSFWLEKAEAEQGEGAS